MNRRVLATGASHSVNRAIVYQLASDKFGVSVHCRSGHVETDAIVADTQANKGGARVLQFDARDRAACRTQLDADVEACDTYYDIVLCTGTTRGAAFPALTDEGWDIVFEVGLDGFYNVVHPLTMLMVHARKGGHIVTIASVSGMMGNRGQVNYSVAKAGLIGTTKTLTVELALRRITVNRVALGLIETDILAHMEHVDQALQTVPTQRVGQPAEVAAVVGFLMLDTTSYVTRQVIGASGEMV